MPVGPNTPPEWEKCMQDLKTKQPDLDGESRGRICWSSIKKTHKRKANGKWVKLSMIREFEEELDFKVTQDESYYAKPTRDEVIEAIRSVPTIPDHDKLISQMDERVRLIKGFKGLTEGVYNGIPFTDEVLKEGAETWNTNPDKPGVPFPVKLEHGKNIMMRAGHLLHTYYDDGWIKHDILLTNKDAADQFDGGHLTDGSERVIVGTDVENSELKSEDDIKLAVAYIKGRGIDFVDNPACKKCGVNPEKESIFEEVRELSEEETELCGAGSPKGKILSKIAAKYSEGGVKPSSSNFDSKGKCNLGAGEDFGGCTSHADVLRVVGKGLGVKSNYTRPMIYEAYRKGVISAADVKSAGYNPTSIKPEKASDTVTSGSTEKATAMNETEEAIDMSEEEIKDTELEVSQEEEGKFKQLARKLGLLKDEESEDEEELCGGAATGGKATKKKPTADDEEEETQQDEDESEEEDLDESEEEEVKYLTEDEVALKVKEALDAKDAEIAHKELAKEVFDKKVELGDEVELADIEKFSDETLGVLKDEVLKRAESTPNGDVPWSSTELAEQSKQTKSKVEELRNQIQQKGYKEV